MRPSPIPREAGTCVSHDVAGGNERATVVRSAGDGARATREDRACLGRVMDRARGVYRSKARGLFPHDLATGEFGPAPEGVEGPRRRNARAAGTAPAVSFGDAFPPGSPLRPGGLTACADACDHAEPAGPSDSCRPPVTAAGNHNGQAGEEVRLTCVARSDAGLPLFFRHVAGNVIDVSTVTRTIAGPGAMGVGTRLAVPGAGYHANASADALMGARVPILARTGPNPGAHGEVVAGHLDGLEARENAVTRDGRLACARCVPVGIGSRGDRRGYAYLCLDSAMRREPGRAPPGGPPRAGSRAPRPTARWPRGACSCSPAPGG